MGVRGKSAKLQPIPKGEELPKVDAKKEKANKETDAKKLKVAQPEQYSARLVHGIVDVLKTQGGRIWKDLKEREQAAVIGLFQNKVEEIIRQMVLDMAGQGHPSIAVKLTKIQFEKQVKIAIQAATATKACHIASEKIDSSAVLVLVDPVTYIGGEMPVADKDQPDLNLPQPDHKAHEPFPDDDFDEGTDYPDED